MLKITSKIISGLINHAKEDAPIEACGYLAAKKEVIVRQYKMRNIDSSEIHFSLDPKEQFDAVFDMRKRGLRLAAIYHSHPASPARPSPEDLKLAHDPDISYVIVSLNHGQEAVKSFRIKESQVEAEEIETIDIPSRTIS